MAVPSLVALWQLFSKLAPMCAESVQRYTPEAPGVARLTAGLRAKFDPRGLFNAPALAHSA